MSVISTWKKLQIRYRRDTARALFRKPLSITLKQPLVSFTFDDFPRSALTVGGAILHRYGLLGTYYVALGLLGSESGPSGPSCTLHDLEELLSEGHELGSHTFGHCHAGNTDAKQFERSILENDEVLEQLIPGSKFESFSYPISEPRPATKWKAAKRFSSCRAGGQTLNTGTADLNQLSAYFLEKALNNIQPIKNLIDRNRALNGWVIFATHDVAQEHGPYGCTPELFDAVVRYSVESGARILPITQAIDIIRCSNRGHIA